MPWAPFRPAWWKRLSQTPFTLLVNIQDKVLGATANPNFRAPKCPGKSLPHTESDGIVFYLSDVGRKAIIGLHVDGIVAYLNDAEPEPFR